MINTVNLTNFKCFEHLCVEGLQRVNLISGKNNIGKTSFMEAIELHLSSKESISLSLNLYKMIKRRQGTRIAGYFELDFIYSDESKMNITINDTKLEIEYFKEFYKQVDQSNNILGYTNTMPIHQLYTGEEAEEEVSIVYEPSLKLTVENESRIIPIDRVINRPMLIRREGSNKQNINFVSSSTEDERKIAVNYGNLIELNKEQYLNDSLNIFDKKITALKQIVTEKDVVLKLLLADRKAPVLLSSLGEGINRYIAILCAIWASQDGYLFIDEIENGIHYTNYPKLWKIIFEASKMANCQIFITTHSKECIEAFNEVNSKDEGAYFEFFRNMKKNLIEAQKLGHEQLVYSLTHGGEVRGE
ncbi:MAG: AAA family ATPase [Campylobacterales bacterium]|nr:AAA family ATPase [Campylobacterales bacterium]